MHWAFMYGGILLSLVLHNEARTSFLQGNSLDTVQEILRNVEPMQLKTNEKSGCSCVQYNCGCCIDLDVPEIKLKDLTCVNVSYLPEEYGFRMTVTINTYTLVNVTVSAKNPPPICFGIPYLEKEASMCIDFYDLDVQNKTLSGCIKLQIHLVHIVIVDQKLGCFHFPLHGRNSVEHALLTVEGLRPVALKLGSAAP